MKKRLIASLLSVSMAFSMLAPMAFASEKAVEATYSKEVVNQMMPVLQAIENIPNELLESGDSSAINQYFRSKNVDIIVFNDAKGEKFRVKQQGWWGCSLAIGELLVLNAVPVAKIAKIKKYIKSLGGTVEAAKLLMGATSIKEKAEAIGIAFAALVAELSGFTELKEKCFD
ncbi:hypothetical protein ABU162_24600 [Paenibacillus thiaminolyticus]|uniref:hypothetical protein n=1 Tax=Paenibacillus thiaminolyticus TaxID=49283 RepID=UPI0035A662F3